MNTGQKLAYGLLGAPLAIRLSTGRSDGIDRAGASLCRYTLRHQTVVGHAFAALAFLSGGATCRLN